MTIKKQIFEQLGIYCGMDHFRKTNFVWNILQDYWQRQEVEMEPMTVQYHLLIA